jgi:protein ImuB
MDRTACINLPVFMVQLLLRRHPDWKNQPVAVVEADKPQGTILQVNQRARSFRILPGMRYAAGLALDGSLRAAVVLEKEVKKAIVFLTDRLQSFSPRVESAADEPGIFWLDARGLERLYGSLDIWAKSIQKDMHRSGFYVSVVVGFNRFGSYALAKSSRGIVVIKSPHDEQIAAQQVSIDCLGLEPKTRDLLEKLGVKTVGRFVNLPSSGVTKRLGSKAYHLHQLASGELRLPLQPEYPQPPAMQRRVLDRAEIDIGRIMAVIQQLLHPLLQKLSDRGRALTEVQVWFRFERIGEHVERIRPAAPTLAARQLLDLIRLRLHSIKTLSDGVVETALVGQSVAAAPEQLRLLEAPPKRDLAAANRALARVRAELGDQAVLRARLREGHLPEGRFIWETFDILSAARPRKENTIRLIRRIHSTPVPLLSCPRRKTKKKKLSGLQMEPVEQIFGPYIISGGWWQRPVHREYYFAETRMGEIQWVYFDQVRKKWFEQGRVA